MIEPTPATGISNAVLAWLVGNAIALLALVQPWVYWGWRRYAKRGSIELHETAKVEVGYSGLGPTLGLFGTLRAVNEDQFVRSVEAVLTRTTDHQRRVFEWAALRPNTFALGAPTDTKFELASGFMLLQSQPQKYNIFFLNSDLQNRINQQVQRLREAFESFCANQRALGIIEGFTEQEFAAAYEQFAQTPIHVDVYSQIDHLFDWQDVQYRLQMHVSTANPDRTFSSEWRFRLTAQDIDNLRLNTIRICQEACKGQAITGYHFAYCSYLSDQQLQLAAAAHA